MADTPTRRPSTYPTGRRHPKGRRPVARSARSGKDEGSAVRAILTAGSAYLKEQPDERQRELAATIDRVLAPGGHALLRTERSQLSLTMTRDLRAAVEKAAPEFDTTKDTLADEACLAVLEGRWLPPETVRTRSRDAAKTASRTVLNVTIAAELREQLDTAKLDELSREAGYKVSLSSIIISWITEEMGIDRDGKPADAPFQMQQYKALRDFWQTVAAGRGVTVDEVVDEGLRALRDGSLTLSRPVVAPRGSRAGEKAAKLTFRMDNGLRDWLVEATPRLSEELDYGMDPGKVVTEILKARLGTPPGWDSPAK